MNMNNLAEIKKRYLQLRPVNASSGGVYSFRNGLPIIKFDISASMMPLLLDGEISESLVDLLPGRMMVQL